jgi:hypothetical protein
MGERLKLRMDDGGKVRTTLITREGISSLSNDLSPKSLGFMVDFAGGCFEGAAQWWVFG